MRIRNVTRETDLATQARVARSFWSRLVGLLGKASLADGEALVITPCSSVHTAFMRFPIDVIYVDGRWRVVKTVPRLRPFRVSAALRGAQSVLELPAGAIEASGTVVGDELAFEP